MAYLQRFLSKYYPQCSGYPSVLDDDIESGNGSVTPLKYVRNRNSRIPSVTDLTGLSTVARNDSSKSTAAAKVKPRRSTAAAHRKRSYSTVSFATKRKPTRSTAAAKQKPTRSTAAAREKPTRSTASAAAKEKNPRSTAAMIHSSTDLLTSTVISMPDAIENENYLGNVDAIEAVV